MADNVAFQSTTLATPAAATSVATDDIGGVHYQRVKLVDGILDGTTALEFNVDDFDTGVGVDNQTLVGLAVAASGGHASVTGDAANGLDVDVTRVSGNVTVVQSTASNLKVDLSGTAANTTAIKVDGSAVTQPVSGTITANAGTGNFSENLAQVGGNSILTGNGVTGTGSPRITIASDNTAFSVNNTKQVSTVPTATTMQNAATANGNGTSLNVSGYSTAILNVTASVAMSGGTTINFEVSVDDTTWVSILANLVGTNTLATTTTTTGDFELNIAGYKSVRARISAYSAGTITIKGYSIADVGTQKVVNANQAGTWNITNVSGTVSLPTGAATAAKQPALGTAGSASADVISVQGIASMTAIKVDGSAVTQPISGTVTANQGGTWTVQPGNTANTTAWKVDGSAVTQPVSGTITANAGTGTFTVDSELPAAAALADAASATPTTPTIGTVPLLMNATTLDRQRAVVNALDSTGTGIAAAGLVGQLDDTATGTVTENQFSTVRISSRRALLVEGVSSGTNVNVNVNAALPTGANIIGALSSNQSVNVAQVAGATTSTAASGVQKVGVVGNAGATVDSTVGAGTAPTNQVVVGSVYNTSAPAPTNTQAMALQGDQAGNLRIFGGIALTTLSAWTSATALNATQNIFTNSGTGSVLVHLVQTSTLTAGAITFEVSYDGTNWVTIPAQCVLDPSATNYAQISVPYTLQANTNKPFLIALNGAQALRIKLSTAITGTGSVTPNYALLPYEPVETVIALSPTASNFNITVGAALPTGSNVIGALSANQSVNVAQINGVATTMGNGISGTGVQRVTIASDSTGQVALAAGSATIGALTANQSVNVAQINGVAATMGNGISGTGVQRITIASDSTGQVALDAQASGGYSKVKYAAQTTTVQTVKSSAGKLSGWYIYNPNSVVSYVQIFDVSGAVTLGTTAPDLTLGIPPTSAANMASDVGIDFANAIKLACTTTATGSTAPGTGLDVNCWFK